MRPGRIDCHRCHHYFVTWNPAFPHGCRGMGFKSRSLPNDAVRQATGGQDCLMFAPRSKPPDGSAANEKPC
jgi:hypothetical protein